MGKAIELFGKSTFNRAIMKKRLSRSIYEQLQEHILKRSPLEKSVAVAVAYAMKEWAIEKGATHFTHWFQPFRGGTAEKHYSFLSYDNEGDLVEYLSAEELIQPEPSSESPFTDGRRTNFEARGYTAWDPASPAFLIGSGTGLSSTKTLVIPSVFLSWNGQVMDLKTVLLRSQNVLNDIAIKLQRLLGNRNAKIMTIFSGLEQEYFLLDKKLFDSRLDLKLSQRTLLGINPRHGQELHSHYFGAIPKKVLKFMGECDLELYRLGIPSQIKHNEVSSNQFEIAPLYEEQNLAIDHNLQLMEIMKQIADKYDMKILFHEKPFKGLSGSGKHLNWSLGDNMGINYLKPSASPLRNITLLITIVSLMLGVKEFGPLLRVAVSSAGNDLRLGIDEAPPNIISVHLGNYLSELLDEIASIKNITEKQIAKISLKVRQMPASTKAVTDVNRTAPIAFTGNKFEFRGIGADQNPSEAAAIFNLLVAYGYQIFYQKIDALKGDPKHSSMTVLCDLIKEIKNIHYEGDWYIADWKKELTKRKLAHIDTTPAALELLKDKKYQKIFIDNQILEKQEIESWRIIKLQRYINTRIIELKTAKTIAKASILPTILNQLAIFSPAINSLTIARLSLDIFKEDISLLQQSYHKIRAITLKMESRILLWDNEKNLMDMAIEISNKSDELLHDLRIAIDEAEKFISIDLWPMSTYRELLENL